MFKVQIGLWSGCLDTDPKQRFVPGDLQRPGSLVTQPGSKMLTAVGGRDLEQGGLLFGFHFGLLYKWLILLFRAAPHVLGMTAIILSLHLSAQRRTTAFSLLLSSKLPHLLCTGQGSGLQTRLLSVGLFLLPHLHSCSPSAPQYLLFSPIPLSQVTTSLITSSKQYSRYCSLHRFYFPNFASTLPVYTSFSS